MTARLAVLMVLGVAGCTPAVAPATSPPTTTAISGTTVSTTTTSTTATTVVVVEDLLQAALARLAEIGPRPAGSAAEQAAADLIEADLEKLGLEVQSEPVPLPTREESRNLWTTIGHGPTAVLLGAHYDSAPDSPGADDNGSGVAVLMELARRLEAAPPTDLTVIVVFFGAEEVLAGYRSNDHHYGSRQMAARMKETGELPDLMVSVDMVGIGNRLLAVQFRDEDPAAQKVLVDAGVLAGIEISAESRGDISDHEAFARAGVPSVFMWRPDNPAWHTPEDTEASTELLLEDLAVLEAFLRLSSLPVMGEGG